MSTSALAVPVEKYLRTVYRPDRDYVDGRLEKRNVGEWNHARLQAALAQYLRNNADQFRVNTVTEMRVRISPTRYRVADICCVRRPPEDTRFIAEPPVLVIEILSPRDTVPATEDRISDYLLIGVPFVWLINPRKLDRAWIYERDQSRREVTDGILTAGQIRVPLAELPEQRNYE